jgi:hypothetical protein
MGLHLGKSQDILAPKPQWTKDFMLKSLVLCLEVEFEVSISVFS